MDTTKEEDGVIAKFIKIDHDYSTNTKTEAMEENCRSLNMKCMIHNNDEDGSAIIDDVVNEICLSVENNNAKEVENYFIKQEPQDGDQAQFNPYNEMLGTGNGFVASLIEVVDNIEENKTTKEMIAISSSEDESSDESSDDSSSSEDEKPDWKPPPSTAQKPVKRDENITKNKKKDIDQLPQIENLEIHLPQTAELIVVGKIISIIDQQLVVVKSYPGKPALNLDTVLFFDRDTAIGMVDETFGRVSEPHYVVRFNDAVHIHKKGVEIGKEVYFAPQSKKYTTFIFMSELRKMRGSDASWKNDQEPPNECIEYSDDEQERTARKERKSNKKTNNADAINSTPPATTVPSSSSNNYKNKRHNERQTGNRNDRWHNQQTRYNVPDNFESMMGWNNAINRMPNIRHRLAHPSMYNCNNPMPLNNLFQSPPPLSPQQMSPRFPVPPNFYQHPPPPPPPPPMINSMPPPPSGFNLNEAISNPWQRNQNNNRNNT